MPYIKLTIICFILFYIPNNVIKAQDQDAYMLRNIYNNALSNGKAYPTLKILCKQYGGRIAGSEIYSKAALYLKDELSNQIPGINAYFQDCEANYWKRGEDEQVFMHTNTSEIIKLNATSLGNSIGTNGTIINGEVIEVKSLNEVEILGKEKIEGKIVFYNRPMDPTQIRTFNAYGGAVDQRAFGPAKAAEYGAAAAIVRSMTTSMDDFAHTGVTIYNDKVPSIPGLAISTNDAERLSKALSSGIVNISIRSSCKDLGLKPAPSVVGEIKGSEYPEEIIVIGGHLDSWDIGEGAHDDGAGCVQSIEVLRILAEVGYKPKRTLRCVLFSNEENGLAGGKTYAKISDEKNEFHLAALESDSGGFTPRSFSFDSDTSVFKTYYKNINQWLPLLEPYGITFEKGGSGSDIGPLKSQKGILIGLRTDSQRYFDFHHTKNDVFENVNKRELELGAAAMASLVYLIDKYGIK